MKMYPGLKKNDGDLFSGSLRRELGLTQPRNFTRRLSASHGLVQQIDLYVKLIGHEGCVNTVEFNSTGDKLVSGSDDRQVIFWDWASKRKTFAYPSGHLENIFQTKIMPFSDDRIIVTSAADGQVIS
ncbi:WD and tetratricopeptide repeats protein 1, partial [Bienertia sinuspersici]